MPGTTSATLSTEVSKAETVQNDIASTSGSSENAAIAVSSDLVSMPSMEKLIPTEKKTPVRTARKIEESKPFRRQPKTGWL